MERRRIIKQGGVVCATHEDGSIDPGGKSSMGLFVGDTRFLSRFQLYIDGLSPNLLGSTEEEMHQAAFFHTNPDLTDLPTRSLGLLQRISIENSWMRGPTDVDWFYRYDSCVAPLTQPNATEMKRRRAQ